MTGGGWATSAVAAAVAVLHLVGGRTAFIGNAFERFDPRRVVLAGMPARGRPPSG